MTVVDTPQIAELSEPRAATVLDLTSKELRTKKPARSGRHLTPQRVVLIVAPAVVGILAVWFILFAFVLTGFQEHAGQARLYDSYRLALAEEVAPLAEPVKPGSPVAMINAPAAGMHNLVVVEGTTSNLLEQGPGHLSDSPLPGQFGDSVILGRSVTYGGPFGIISHLKPGDRLTITDGQGVFQYRVEDIRYPGDRLPTPLKAEQSRVTLVTSAAGGWESGWAPSHTVYLDAILVRGQAQPVPAGVPTSVGKSSLPMQEDPSAIVALIFWLEALVAAALAINWSWARWGRSATWIAGAPVLLVTLWGTSDALMRFLPNLL